MNLKSFGKWSATAFVQVQRVVPVVWTQIAAEDTLSENLDHSMTQVNELTPVC